MTESALTSKNLHIADFGCGKGGLLQYLYGHGYRNLLGVDASPGCIRHIQEHGAFPGVCSTLDDFQTAEPFDVIFCCQVLEHVFSCRDLLKKIYDNLTAHGILYIEMPDAGGYRKHLHAPFYFFDQEHINHFQSDSLCRLLKDCGFFVRKVYSYVNEPTDGFFTQNLAAVAEKSDSAGKDFSRNDPAPILEYIADSRKREQQREPIPAQPGYGYLWGVGAHCLRLLNEETFSQLRLKGMIDLDRSKQGKTFSGLKVFSPDVLKCPSDEPVFVVITSVLYEKSIRKMLRDIGFHGQILTAAGGDFQCHHP